MNTSRAGCRSLVVAVAALAVWIVGAGNALACPVCFGQADGPMIDAARLGVWLLLAVVLSLQGGFAAFFLYLRRRARQAAEQAIDAEWAELQREHGHGWRSA
jgi:hypothetical protein